MNVGWLRLETTERNPEVFGSETRVLDYCPNAILTHDRVVMLTQSFDDRSVLMSWVKEVLDVPVQANHNKCELEQFCVCRVDIDSQ